MILLIEDNLDDEALTIRALERNNIGNKMVVARDGVEALDFLFGTGIYEERDLSVMPQLILLDLKLPKLDGLEVLRRIRSDEATRLLPVVVLTSCNEEQDRITSYGLGANSYVRKPVDFNQFVAGVRQLGLYWLILNEAPPVRMRKVCGRGLNRLLRPKDLSEMSKLTQAKETTAWVIHLRDLPLSSSKWGGYV